MRYNEIPILIGFLFRKGNLVTSDEGKLLQKRVWAEIVEILNENMPASDEHLARVRPI